MPLKTRNDGSSPAKFLTGRSFYGVLVAILAILLLRFFAPGGLSFYPESHLLSIKEESPVKDLFPGASFLEEDEEVPGRVSVFGDTGDLLGHVVSSAGYSDHIRGYAGPTPVLIAKTPAGRISGLALLENTETPSFVENVVSSDLLDRFDGLQWREAITKDVDAVTGATATSKAIINTVRHRLSLMEPRLDARVDAGKRWDLVITIIIGVMALMAATIDFRHKKAFRKSVLLVSLVWLGFARAELLSMDVIADWAISGVVTGAALGLFVIFLLSVGFSLVTGGRLYCGYICPFGALQEFAGRASSGKVCLSRGIFVCLSKIRYALLLVIWAGLFFFPALDLTLFEPFTAFVPWAAAMSVILLAAVSLVLSFFVFRPWCSFLCPTGAFLDMFRTKQRPGRKK